MTVRHPTGQRDRFGAVLTASWATLHLVALATLGMVIQHQQATDADRLNHTATAPDTGPAGA